MTENQNLNSNYNSFRYKIEHNEKYIDKTEAIYDLIWHPNAFIYYPKGFGKSLLVDTIYEIFQANKELFKGLSIYNSDYKWKKYTVIKLKMSDINESDPQKFEKSLNEKIISIGNSLGIDLLSSSFSEDLAEPRYYIDRLVRIIKRNTNQNAVILVDDYDYPILNNLDKIPEFYEILMNFYCTFKALDGDLHFFLLAGTIPISFTTIFGGLNNLNYLTYESYPLPIVGYNQEEFEKHFEDKIQKGANITGMDKNSFINKVKEWYQGYMFDTE